MTPRYLALSGLVLASTGAMACAALVSVDDVRFVRVDAGEPEPEDAGVDSAPPVCMADIKKDPSNCGACDFACKGGAPCNDGMCGGQVIASSLQLPTALALGGNSLYWLVRGQSATTTGAIQTCTIGTPGGPCGPVSSIRQALAAPLAMDVAGNNLYFIEILPNRTGNVSRCGLPGCTGLEVLATGQGDPQSIAAANGRAFWTATLTGTLHASDLPPTEPPTGTLLVANRVLPTSVAARNDTVYWVEPSGVLTCPGLPPCNPRPVADTVNATMVTVDATNVYFARGSNPAKIVKKRRDNTGPAEELATAEGPVGLVSDGTTLTWANKSDGTIVRCAVAGCGGKPTVVAAGQVAPVAVAVDNGSVYFATQQRLGPTGDIRRVPIPK